MSQSIARHAPELIFAALGLGLAAAVASIPLNGYLTSIVMQAATYTIAVVGITVVLGYAGQITLAQAAFFGLGAYGFALSTTALSLDPWIALALAVTLAGVFGAVLGLTSVRLGGHYLAMITISFQQILTLVLTNWTDVTGGPDGVSGIPRPTLPGIPLTSDANYLAFCILVLALVAIGVCRLRTTRLGRQMGAVRDNELAASVNGIDAYKTKVVAFTLSAALAGLGGALFASGSAYISPDQFSLSESIVFLTMALLGGVGSVFGTTLGAILLILLPESLRFLKEYYLAVYGVAVVLIMIFMPEGIWGVLESFWRHLVPIRPTGSAAAPLRITRDQEGGEYVLETDGMSKFFGGLKALDGIDLRVRRNEIHALLGPNGSGKTTCVNVLSGLYTPTAGRIRFQGREVTGRPPHRLAALGLARTFQNIRLFTSMTCLENAMIGAQRPGAALGADGGDVEARARSALDFVGLIDRADEPVTKLSYGMQRKVEIARALAADPRLLLLDEPAAGLNLTEKLQLAELLLRMKGLGLTMLIIEHDMALIDQVADAITVFNFGQRIGSGSPAVVLNDPAVIKAYLGEPRTHAAA